MVSPRWAQLWPPSLPRHVPGSEGVLFPLKLSRHTSTDGQGYMLMPLSAHHCPVTCGHQDLPGLRHLLPGLGLGHSLKRKEGVWRFAPFPSSKTPKCVYHLNICLALRQRIDASISFSTPCTWALGRHLACPAAACRLHPQTLLAF